MNPILPPRVEKIKGGSAIDHGGNRLISLTFGSGECGFLYGWGGEGTGARGARSRAR